MGSTICCCTNPETQLGSSVSVGSVSALSRGGDGENDALFLLGWRAPTVTLPLSGPVGRRSSWTRELSDVEFRQLEADAEALRAKVAAFLCGPDVTRAAVTPEAIKALAEPDSDWRPLVHQWRRRIQACNALGGPRMHLVWWGSLKTFGQLPRYPREADAQHILDAEHLVDEWIRLMDGHGKVGSRSMGISFVSHRWERPSPDQDRGHPDSADNKKARGLIEYGERGTSTIFDAHHKMDYYYWIDFAGINQSDLREKVLGTTKLGAYVAACSEVVMYNSATVDYEPRAWTRLERMLGHTYTFFPLLVYLDDGYPYRPLDIDSVVSANPQAFVTGVDGSLMIVVRDPLGGDAGLADASDRPLIVHIASALRSAALLRSQAGTDGSEKPAFAESPPLVLDTDHYCIDQSRSMQRMESMRNIFCDLPSAP